MTPIKVQTRRNPGSGPIGLPPHPSSNAVKPLGPPQFELVAIVGKQTGVIFAAQLGLQSGYNGLQLVEGAKSGRLKQD